MTKHIVVRASLFGLVLVSLTITVVAAGQIVLSRFDGNVEKGMYEVVQRLG